VPGPVAEDVVEVLDALLDDGVGLTGDHLVRPHLVLQIWTRSVQKIAQRQPSVIGVSRSRPPPMTELWARSSWASRNMRNAARPAFLSPSS
jgi:hypothetical protein